jgi:hypothetical protein
MEDYSISFRKTKGQPWLNSLAACPAERPAAANFNNTMKKLIFEVFDFVSSSLAKTGELLSRSCHARYLLPLVLIYPSDPEHISLYIGLATTTALIIGAAVDRRIAQRPAPQNGSTDHCRAVQKNFLHAQLKVFSGLAESSPGL